VPFRRKPVGKVITIFPSAGSEVVGVKEMVTDSRALPI